MSPADRLRVTINIDGGSRGNPGPAGAGVVVRKTADGTILREEGVFLGQATNNVAEYQGLLTGLRAAAEIGAAEVECISDSELMVKQMNGQYRVKNAGLRPLHEEAMSLQQKFDQFSIRHVPREQNEDADQLVNQAINLRRDIKNPAE